MSGLIDQGDEALQSAMQAEGAAAGGLASTFMGNKALKFDKQAGLGQLLGTGFGYELEKQRLKSLMPQQQVENNGPHGPSMMLGSILRHLYQPFLPQRQVGDVTSYNMEPY